MSSIAKVLLEMGCSVSGSDISPVSYTHLDVYKRQRIANMVAVTYPESAKYFPRNAKVRLTGNPIRRSILETKRNQGLAAFGLNPCLLYTSRCV